MKRRKKMAKVYIFRNYDADELEDNINEFIADKELIDIKINTTLAPDALNGLRLWTTAVVIYEEKTPSVGSVGHYKHYEPGERPSISIAELAAMIDEAREKRGKFE
jgi:hypothetical protein